MTRYKPPDKAGGGGTGEDPARFVLKMIEVAWADRSVAGGPVHRRVPFSAKKTRSSAAIRIVARKNRRDDGLR